MNRVHWEILASIVFVLGGTAFMWSWLSDMPDFWDEQRLWSFALITGYTIVSFEYFRQGWKIHHARSPANISTTLTTTIMLMQCVLFVKGVYFGDWSLIVGALIYNCGVIFLLYQTIKTSERYARMKARARSMRERSWWA